MNKGRIKRLFLDIETSPNVGLFWHPGHEISVGYESIIKERSIICVGYKWEGDAAVSCVSWNGKQSDKRVVRVISELIAEADEVVTHNGDKFDLTWIRGRCLKHGFPMPPRLVTQDTCALSRRLFNLNSHRLDYIAKYLGIGQKIATGYDLWKSVLLDNDRTALGRMVKYCKRDVELLEKVWNRMKPYVPSKVHLTGILRDCPECGSDKLTVRKHRTSAAGTRTVQLVCGVCNKYTTVSRKKFAKF